MLLFPFETVALLKANTSFQDHFFILLSSDHVHYITAGMRSQWFSHLSCQTALTGLNHLFYCSIAVISASISCQFFTLTIPNAFSSKSLL